MHRSTMKGLAAAAALFVGVAGVGVQSAEAQVSTTFRNAPVATTTENGIVGSAAVTNDPNLSTRVFNAMLVTIPPGADWTNSQLRLQLTAGQVYNAPDPDADGVDTESSPASSFTSAPRGAYDTFVNSKPSMVGNPPRPRPLGATILGKLNPDGSAAPPPAIGLIGNTSPQLVSVAWGNTVGGEDGTFQVAQITLSPDAAGTIFGATFSNLNPGIAVPFSFPIAGGAIVPEPASIGLVSLGALGLLARRRRSA